MAYAPTKVARKFLELAKQDSRPLTPLELIKLTYLAHGWSLALRDEPLVREPAQAWQYGPVYPGLYRVLKHYRADAVDSVPVAGAEHFETDALSQEDESLIDAVYQAYKKFNGVQLSSLTHQPGTPWDEAWRSGKNSSIKDAVIKDHFRRAGGQQIGQTS